MGSVVVPVEKSPPPAYPSVLPQLPWQRSWYCRSRSAKGTKALAMKLAQAMPPRQVVALMGTLGAGKTTFVQGLAQGLGALHLHDVLSPTYTLVNTYPTADGPLVHLDLYRLGNKDAVAALGLDDVMQQPARLVVVEWACRHPELFDADTVWLHLQRADDGGDGRHRLLHVLGMAPPLGVTHGRYDDA